MKIGMPKDGESINQHFGQSRSFLVAEIEGGKVKEMKEISSEALQHNHEGLAGLFTREGVSLVIVGGIGQPAIIALQEKGLQVIRGASGRCEDILQKYISGELVDQNVNCNHHGDQHGHHHH